jgi:orotidine-5'-phosphate decarboxylase
VTTGVVDRFGVRLRAAMDDLGPFCVGIDPHPNLLRQWGLPGDVVGLEAFAMTCVEAFAGRVAVVKPQSAFFEVHGSAGVAVLERVLHGLRGSGTLTLLDVKRGDIGSTMAAYAQAYLGDGSPLAADAVTTSPYLGYGSLRPALDRANATGRGVFVLALTSNPEGREVQHARGRYGSVAGTVVARVTADNAAAAASGELGSVGMVVGATVGAAVGDLGLDLAGANAPLLAPGFGAQGGTVEDLRSVFGAAVGNVLPAISRDILACGPDLASLRKACARAVSAVTPLSRP